MRYSNETIERIWSEEKTIAVRMHIEHEWLLNMHYLRLAERPPAYNEADTISVMRRSKEIEKLTNHDVASFVIALEELFISKGYKDHRMVHFGLTSSDICDTSLSLAYRSSFDFILAKLRKFVDSPIADDIVVPARTHGADTGIELSFKKRMRRMFQELDDSIKWIKSLSYYGKLSGPVGLGDAFTACCRGGHKTCEVSTLSTFSLDIHPAATQVIPRHIYADYHCKMAILGKTLSRIANTIRLSVLAGDVKVVKTPGEIGSSSMPHKINPWQLERVVGMSRMLDSHAMTALQNIDLWFERDISHSCVERVNPKDGFNYLSTMIDDIGVYLNRISNTEKTSLLAAFNPYKALNEMVLNNPSKSRAECHKEVEEKSIRYSRA